MSDLEKRAERARQACQVIQQPNAAYDEIQRLQSELTAAREENERVRLANLDVMNHYEDARDEAERLRARVAELEERSGFFVSMVVLKRWRRWAASKSSEAIQDDIHDLINGGGNEADNSESWGDRLRLANARIAELTEMFAQGFDADGDPDEWRERAMKSISGGLPSANAFIRRKAADYIEEWLHGGSDMGDLVDYAQRLRQSADEAEKEGG